MKKHRKFIPELFIATLISASTVSAAETFVTQGYVDSLIDRAWYYLNSSADPGSGISIEQALSRAKEIAKQLKETAENDANRGYILSKVNELDGQIYLEERGLLEEKENYNQRSVNELVAQFNSELAQPLPSFQVLTTIQNRVSAIDIDKGQEIQGSIYKRIQSVLSQIKTDLEESIESGAFGKSREILSYVEHNREYLGVSIAQYASLSARIQAKSSIADERLFIGQQIDSGKVYLNLSDIKSTRRILITLMNRLSEIRPRLNQFEWQRLYQDAQRLERKLSSKEDSLMQKAEHILHDQGVTVASNFLDTLRLRGVPPEKINKLDRTILEIAVAQSRNEDHLKQNAFVSFIDVEDTAETVSALDQILLAAKQKARARKDSLSSFTQENARLTQIDEVRRDRMKVAGEERMRRDQERIIERQKQAKTELVQIYLLIEQGKKSEASVYFSKVKAILQEGLPAEDFKKISKDLL